MPAMKRFTKRDLEKILAEKQAIRTELFTIKNMLAEAEAKTSNKAAMERKIFKEKKRQLEDRYTTVAKTELIVRESLRQRKRTKKKEE
jgi:hypothetical protein